ncbi:type II secretion system protein [Cellulomonas endophytica]|uniref:type II secretion system protein n=1 Tax=Cellulomonas endophytica TaxID=2494735 RepID=UPI0013E93EBE|nr:type II secretion system protein [Cellulomonas endophytica]
MLTRLRRRLARDEAGFTLIELIISIGLLGLLFSALSLVMLSTARVNDETQHRLDLTRDEQFTAAYFATDVAGATDVATGAAARCGSGTATVELRGTSFSPTATPPTPTTTVVSYVFSTTTTSGVTAGSVVRRACEQTTAGAPAYPWTPTSSETVAERLATTPPVVTCSTAGTPAACSAATTTVSVSFARLGGGDPFVLSATRRTTP